MGVFSRDPDHSTEECGHQAAGENEGVSIFFGRSSIDTVKSLAGKWSSSIPKQFQEDVNASPSPGSVARKAAFFDQYIRTLSLEKASCQQQQQQEDDLASRQEDGGDQNDHGSCMEGGEQNISSTVGDSHEEVAGSFVERGGDDEGEGEEEEEMNVAVAVDYVSGVEADGESDVETRKVDDMSIKEQQSLETGDVEDDAAEAIKTTQSSENGTAGVLNKWKSKSGLIPGVRALEKAQATGKVTAKKRVTPSKVNKGTTKVQEISVVPKEKQGSKPSTPATGGFHFRSQERAEKRKEFNRRMEEKLSAREAEKNQQQAKTEEEKQADIRELRRALNFKATPMPDFYYPASSSRKSTKHSEAKQQSSGTKKDSSRRREQQLKSKGMMGKASAIAVSS